MLNIKNMFSGAKGAGAISQRGSGPERSEGPVPSFIVLIVIPLLLIANFFLFFILLSYTKRTNEALAKLSAMELALSKGFEGEGELSGEIQKINQKMDALQATLKELKKEGEARDFAIETLTKAKNTLFNRLNELESKQ